LAILAVFHQKRSFNQSEQPQINTDCRQDLLTIHPLDSRIALCGLPYNSANAVNPKPIVMWYAINARHTASNVTLIAMLFNEICIAKAAGDEHATEVMATIRSKYSQVIAGKVTYKQQCFCYDDQVLPDNWSPLQTIL
jgi:hypothetical protein